MKGKQTGKRGLGVWSAVLVTLVMGSAVIAGCGGDGDPASPDDFAPRYTASPDAKPGGTLRVLAGGDIDSLDPGVLANQFSFMVSFSTQRPLFASPTAVGEEPMPDLAAAPPEVDRAAGRIDVRIREDVGFSPPVDRPVVAKDVKYAIERSLLPGVANGFVETFLGDLAGFAAAQRRASADPEHAPDIRGIEVTAPDRLTFRFRGPVPALAVDALTLPVTAPVPEEYAARFDAKLPSTYGLHAVATGPYMVENDDEGELVGYRPGKSIDLVRNPSWSADTDFRPAFLDEIAIEVGYSSTAAASRSILSGSGMINGDFAPDPGSLRLAMRDYPEQLMMIPAGAILYASLNTTIPPLDDLDVRRAVVAAADRVALRLARGGASLGPLATHFIPPGVAGFEQAGGLDGPDLDFLDHPRGDLELARSYMRKAGYDSGSYDGDAKLSMVTDNTAVGRDTGEIVRQALDALGIQVRSSAVTQDTMYSRFCNVPAAKVAICPNVGWVRQFDDAQTVLDPTFNGQAIHPVNNSNWPQLDVPAINAAIDRTKEIFPAGERATEWAEIDRRITAQAPAIPIMWSKVASITSDDVLIVIDRSLATPMLPMISLTDPDGG